jgi:hypothetical protein
MKSFSASIEFDRILRDFQIFKDASLQIQSPNPEDDRFILLAISGFSFYEKTENWRDGHFQIIRDYINETSRLDYSENIKSFNSVALGTLLGLFSSGKITQENYNLGIFQLAGYVLSQLPEIEKKVP